MFSRLPRSSMWLSPTLVTRPHCGRTNPHSSSSWCKPRMPISTMTFRVSAWAASTVLGTPSSLFWLPFVAHTLPAATSTSRTRFFVVVLPVDPVMPMTRPSRRSRHARASAVTAAWVSGTWITAAPAAAISSSEAWSSACCASTHTAPAATEEAAKACPSTRSPGSAT